MDEALLHVILALQVQWHSVLGNHDYGELWRDNGTSTPQPTNCPNTYRDAECSYGPLAQVDNPTQHWDAPAISAFIAFPTFPELCIDRHHNSQLGKMGCGVAAVLHLSFA